MTSKCITSSYTQHPNKLRALETFVSSTVSTRDQIMAQTYRVSWKKLRSSLCVLNSFRQPAEIKSLWLINSEYSHILRVCKAVNRCIFLYVKHLNISESRAGERVTGNAALPFHLRTAIQAKTRVKMMTFEFFMTFKKSKKQKHQPKNRFPSHTKVELFSLRQRGSLLFQWLAQRRKEGVLPFCSDSTPSPTKNTRLPQTCKHSHFLPA